jgi:adenosylcobinamide-phosphate synthase
MPAMTVPVSSTARAAGIALGVIVDACVGDPRRGHPVAVFGRWAGFLERHVYAPSRMRGAAFTVAAVAGPVLLGVVAERVSERRPVLRILLTAASTWIAVGGTSLAKEGRGMAAALQQDDLPSARERLTHLCARDPSGLAADQLARATVESLAENTSDAVVAPVLWAAFLGAPGVLGYRAVNTLDAMVGYRSERYQDFGWASARLDDLVNLLPSRLTGVLTVGCAPLVGGSPRRAWRVWCADCRRHPSPNAGHCESAAAGALDVQLGGSNVYAGRVETRPVVGADGRPPDWRDIRRGAALSRYVGYTAAAIAILFASASLPAWRTLARRTLG